MLESLGIWSDLRHTVIRLQQAQTDLQVEKATLVGSTFWIWDSAFQGLFND